jgi:hypothetical protein
MNIKIFYWDCNKNEFIELENDGNIPIGYPNLDIQDENSGQVIKLENFSNQLLDDIVRYVPIKITIEDTNTGENNNGSQDGLGEDVYLVIELKESGQKRGIGVYQLARIIEDIDNDGDFIKKYITGGETSNVCEYLASIVSSNSKIEEFEKDLRSKLAIGEKEKVFIYSGDGNVSTQNPKLDKPYYSIIKLVILNNAFYTQSGQFVDSLNIKLIKKT